MSSFNVGQTDYGTYFVYIAIEGKSYLHLPVVDKLFRINVYDRIEITRQHLGGASCYFRTRDEAHEFMLQCYIKQYKGLLNV